MEQRMKSKKSQKEYETMIRREAIRLKNLSKDLKQQRFQIKNQHRQDQLRDKLELDEKRKQAMRDQRIDLKEVRMRALFSMERQRQEIRNALFQMSVWNTFDPNLVKQIFNQKHSKGGSQSIEELVRQTASRHKLNKRRQMSQRSR